MTLHENIVQGNCLAFYNKSLFGILKKCQQSTDIVEKKKMTTRNHIEKRRHLFTLTGFLTVREEPYPRVGGQAGAVGSARGQGSPEEDHAEPASLRHWKCIRMTLPEKITKACDCLQVILGRRRKYKAFDLWPCRLRKRYNY